MKKLMIILAAALLLCSCAPANTQNEKTLARYGDSSKDWPSYTGQTSALFPVYVMGKVALMDAKGTIVLNGQYSSITRLQFTQEDETTVDTPFYVAQKVAGEESEYYLVNEKGELADKTGYQSIQMRSKDIIELRYGDKIKLVDLSLREIVKDLKYYPIINDDMISLNNGTKTSLIKRDGTKAMPGEYESVGNFGEGLVPVSVGGKWGYVDYSGNTVVKPQFAYADKFSEGFAAVTMDKKTWAFIDKTGTLKTGYDFEYCSYFENGLALVQKDDMTALIGTDMKLLSGYDYDTVYAIGEGYQVAYNTANGALDLYDKKGKVDTKDAQVVGMAGKDRFIVQDEGGFYGLVDRNFNTVVEANYSELIPAKEGIIAMRKVNGSKMYGVIDKDGKELLKPLYQQMREYNGFYEVFRGVSYGYIDVKGNWVVRTQRCNELVD